MIIWYWARREHMNVANVIKVLMWQHHANLLFAVIYYFGRHSCDKMETRLRCNIFITWLHELWLESFCVTVMYPNCKESVCPDIWFFLISGKYMQMMNVLKPIAFDVVICVSQLFDYYLFAVSMWILILHLRHEI